MDMNDMPEYEQSSADAAQANAEVALTRIRAVVDTHIQGWLTLGYPREEALFFGGQLHAHLINQL